MPRRHVALLLLAVFLGAGTTLPGPDALLHHWGGSAVDYPTHVEAAGGCASHAEQCTLGRTATGASAALVAAPILRAAPPAAAAAVYPGLLRAGHADLGRLPPSRAPPAIAAGSA